MPNQTTLSGDSKPWYQSTTIISSIVVAICAALSLFGIKVDDLSGDIQNGLLGVGVLVGTIITIIGRVRASKTISSKGDGGGSAAVLFLALLSLPLLTSCGTTGASTASQDTASATADSTSSVSKALPFIRPAVALTCSTVLNLAVSDNDRVDKANYIYAIAKAVRTLAGGSVPTVDDVKSVIELWAPDKTHWATLATSISSIYGGIFSQIQGDGKLALQVLEAIASGCEDAAGSVVSAASSTSGVTP